MFFFRIKRKMETKADGVRERRRQRLTVSETGRVSDRQSQKTDRISDRLGDGASDRRRQRTTRIETLLIICSQ